MTSTKRQTFVLRPLALDDIPATLIGRAFAVATARHRHGLLRHVFGKCYRRGIQQVVLTVDSTSRTGATELYKRGRMHVFLQWDTYQKELSRR